MFKEKARDRFTIASLLRTVLGVLVFSFFNFSSNIAVRFETKDDDGGGMISCCDSDGETSFDLISKSSFLSFKPSLLIVIIVGCDFSLLLKILYFNKEKDKKN